MRRSAKRSRRAASTTVPKSVLVRGKSAPNSAVGCVQEELTPNLGIDRTPERRRFACCSGAGHARR